MRVPDGSVAEWVDLAPTGSGALDGVSVAAKEIFEVAGHRRLTGTDLVLPGTPKDDAPALQCLRAAGARVTARSVSHGFAWGITNRRADGTGTENPLLADRVSGGSSGGSAALVAAGVVDLGLGSDTAGSARIPPAFCGAYGWKASNGAVPLDGCLPLAPRFDCVGLIARSPSMLRSGAEALGVHGAAAGSDARSRAVNVAVLDPAVWRVTDPERARALDRVATRLDVVDAVTLPDPAAVFGMFSVLQAAEVLRAHRDIIGTWPHQAAQYPAFVRERLLAAESVDVAAVQRAEADLGDLLRAMDSVWAEFEVVLSVLPCGPSSIASPDVVQMPDGPRPLRDVLVPWTCLANLVGSPAAVAPVGVDASGAPIAVQVMSRPGSDGSLLRLLDEWFGG